MINGFQSKIFRYLFLILKFAVIFTINPMNLNAQSFEDSLLKYGLNAYEEQNYDLAFETLEPLAKHGIPTAQAAIAAIMYFQLDNKNHDANDARKFAEFGASKYDNWAQYILGIMLVDNSENANDIDRAIRLLCGINDPNAQMRVRKFEEQSPRAKTCIHEPKVEPADLSQSELTSIKRKLNEASTDGDAKAAMIMSQISEFEGDQIQKMFYRRLAADLGYPLAADQLSRDYLRGDVTEDLSEIEKNFIKYSAVAVVNRNFGNASRLMETYANPQYYFGKNTSLQPDMISAYVAGLFWLNEVPTLSQKKYVVDRLEEILNDMSEEDQLTAANIYDLCIKSNFSYCEAPGFENMVLYNAFEN